MACTITDPCPTANITYFNDYFTYANTVTGDAFGFVLLFMTFFVSFITLRAFPVNQSIPASFFICLGFSMILSLAEIVGQQVVFLMAALAIGSAVAMNIGKR